MRSQQIQTQTVVRKAVRVPSWEELIVSAETYETLIITLLSTIDLLMTYPFRYPGLFESSPEKARTIEEVSGPVGGAISLGMLTFVSIQAYYDYKEQLKAFRKQVLEIKAYLDATTLSNDKKENKEKKLALLKKIMTEQLISQKYESITHSQEDPSTSIALIKPEAAAKEAEENTWWEGIKTVTRSTWNALGIASFSYWILYISWAVATGGGTPIVPFLIVSFVLGIFYLSIKAYQSWKRHHGKNVTVDGAPVEVVEDAPQLDETLNLRLMAFRKACLLAEEERLKTLAGLTADDIQEVQTQSAGEIVAASPDTLEELKHIQSLYQNRKRKFAITLLTASVSYYIGAHYASFIITDLLKAAAQITLDATGVVLGIGVGFMVLSIGFGIYDAYKKHQKIKEKTDEINNSTTGLNATKTSLEATYQEKYKILERLHGEFGKAYVDTTSQAWLQNQWNFWGRTTLGFAAPTEPETRWGRFKQYFGHLFNFLNFAMTGAMIVRVFAIVGTALFIPVVAASLAHPVTLGILITAGVIYGGIKMYQRYQNNKEARAIALLQEREAKIEFLKKQIEIANLQIKVFEKRDSNLVDSVVNNRPYVAPPRLMRAQTDLTLSSEYSRDSHTLTPPSTPTSTSASISVVSQLMPSVVTAVTVAKSSETQEKSTRGTVITNAPIPVNNLCLVEQPVKKQKKSSSDSERKKKVASSEQDGALSKQVQLSTSRHVLFGASASKVGSDNTTDVSFSPDSEKATSVASAKAAFFNNNLTPFPAAVQSSSEAEAEQSFGMRSSAAAGGG